MNDWSHSISNVVPIFCVFIELNYKIIYKTLKICSLHILMHPYYFGGNKDLDISI